MKNIAIFASGTGTNAERIIRYFQERNNACVRLVLTNKPTAGVIQKAENLGVETRIFDRDTFFGNEELLHELKKDRIDLIVLAGFLWLVPQYLLRAYDQRIINIHPALLPKYGGKGMFGHHVHDAVLKAGEERSGITIHYVNEKYDDGQIIFQAAVDIDKGETAESLAKKIHRLEYAHYPRVIDELLQTLPGSSG